MWGSTLVNAALFALIFPSYIITAMHAHPVPIDPYNPSSPTSASAVAPILHPSPYVPIRLRVFAPVIFLNDCILHFLQIEGLQLVEEWKRAMRTTARKSSCGLFLERLRCVRRRQRDAS